MYIHTYFQIYNIYKYTYIQIILYKHKHKNLDRKPRHPNHVKIRFSYGHRFTPGDIDYVFEERLIGMKADFI